MAYKSRGGELENPWNEHLKTIHVLSVAPEDAPDEPTYVDIDFEAGVPVAVDGEKLDPVSLLTKLNELGSKNGVGTIDIIENRLVGMKSRGVYETPGGTILFAAHAGLEQLILDRDTTQYKKYSCSEVCSAGIRWSLVHTSARSHKRFRRRDTERSYRNSKNEIIQRQCNGSRKEIALFPL